jgi:dTDP-glucose 4,6-dehydratase|tara:strand:+ start:508 stop:1434 length:927 start_codon:yes stop_codon:yes gene_type:complete
MIFVTGGAGFIGSNFVHYLSGKGYDDIVILDKLTYAGDMDNLYPLEYPVKGVDIADEYRLAELFARYKPKAIFHFAAETHVDNSISDVYPFVDTNVIGTVNLLNLSVKHEVDRFHHISTDEVYGALGYDDDPFSETTPYDPQNPYSASKASSDHFVMSYHNTYGLPTVITNCSNNYGPRQNKEKLIPKIITNILDEKKIPVYGKGENIRDWIYVDDHCKAILDVFYAGGVGEKYNIGGECEIKNIDLVKNIIDLMGASEDLIEYVDDRPGHDLRYAIDNAKIKDTLNFQPQHTLEEGLEKTIKWYNIY